MSTPFVSSSAQRKSESRFGSKALTGSKPALTLKMGSDGRPLGYSDRLK
jgi:hypothetical protein